MSSTAFMVLWIFWVVVIWVLYHKVFSVYYFNLGKGLLKELIVAALSALMMAAITVSLWYVAVILILLFGFSMMKKTNRKRYLIFAIILAVIMAIAGIPTRPDGETENSEKTDTERNDDAGKVSSSSGGEFMTEKEKEESQRVQEETERLEAEWEEYIQNHVVTLDGSDPLEMFQSDVTCYDVTEKLGARDEAEQNASYLVDVYYNVAFKELTGKLKVYYYSGHPEGDVKEGYVIDESKAPNHIARVEWNYHGSEREQCLNIMEKLVLLYEEKYGDYKKEYFEKESLTVYKWGNLSLSIRDKKECSLEVYKDIDKTSLSEAEKDLRQEMILNTQHSGQDFVYMVDDPYTTVLTGEYINEDGRRLSIQLDPERKFEGQCLLSFSDREGKYVLKDIEGMNNKYSFSLYSYYGYDNLGAMMNVMFYVAFSEDFSKAYVLQGGYPYKNYTGVYMREGAIPAAAEKIPINNQNYQEYAIYYSTSITNAVIVDQEEEDVAGSDKKLLIMAVEIANINDTDVQINWTNTTFPILYRDEENGSEMIYPIGALDDDMNEMPAEYEIKWGESRLSYWVYEVPPEYSVFSIYCNNYYADGTAADGYWIDFYAEYFQ